MVVVFTRLLLAFILGSLLLQAALAIAAGNRNKKQSNLSKYNKRVTKDNRIHRHEKKQPTTTVSNAPPTTTLQATTPKADLSLLMNQSVPVVLPKWGILDTLKLIVSSLGVVFFWFATVWQCSLLSEEAKCGIAEAKERLSKDERYQPGSFADLRGSFSSLNMIQRRQSRRLSAASQVGRDTHHEQVRASSPHSSSPISGRSSRRSRADLVANFSPELSPIQNGGGKQQGNTGEVNNGIEHPLQ